MLVNNSDNHKNTCEFAEETVRYLYGETGEAQSAELRSHLKSCSSCADELSAFTSIHSSIQNWKAAEFDILASPVIEIPTDLRQKSGAETSVSVSWLANLRERFSFPLGWVPAGAFAALLICLAFGLYFLTFSDNEELVSEKRDKITSEVTPNPENKTAEIAKSEPESQNGDDFDQSENSKPDDSLANLRVDEKRLPDKKPAPAKISSNRKNLEVKEKPQKQPLNRKIQAPEIYANVAPVNNNRNLPKLNNLPEETEEEDLRLADLLDEIDEG